MRVIDKFYVDGCWVKSVEDRAIDVINPATETVVGRLALGGQTDVERAVAAAVAAFESYGRSSREDRIEILTNVGAQYSRRMPDIIDAITTEMGAPIGLSSGLQVSAGQWQLAAVLEVLKSFRFEEDSKTTRICREPVGVCALITPWNWPMNQIACKVAPALAAGCTMVLKPSEVAPFSAQIFAEVMHAAGVPAGVFNMVHGTGAEVGTMLSRHPKIDMVSVTGSIRAGSAVQANAAATIKRVAQELGGKSANIILDDVDVEQVVTRDVVGAMLNTGQSCAALTRMLIPRAWMDRVSVIARDAVASLKVGDPRREDTVLGPIAHGAQFRKVIDLIKKGIDEGATLVTGGLGRPKGLEAGYFVRPTVFANVTSNMTIAREEIFGPVLCIMGYEDEEEAIRIANDSDLGLSGGVSSRNLERAQRVASRLRTGIVHINGAHGDIMAPFGGYRQSGNGREWGAYGLMEFLETKAILGFAPG